MAIRDYLKKLINKDSNAPEHYVNTGSTGTEIYSGHFNEEYLQKFNTMPEGIDTYDEMRRSDAQIQMLLSAVKIPIVAAQWGVEAVDDSDEEKEIADFVQFCLFEDIGYPDGSKSKPWRDFLQEALTSLDFGYSLFEPVYKVVMDHPVYGNYIGVRDIAYRSQKTIEEWHLNTNGSIKYVRQLAQGDLAADVKIPGENVIVISVNKEGDNYEGISLLRPLYGNWLRKNFYYKIQAMGIERCATGVLVGKVPVSAQDDEAQFNKFKSMLRSYTTHQNNFLMHPEGWEITVSKIDFDASDVESAIDAEDRRMAKGFLAGFLELGMGGQAGSQSLGQDLSTIFLNGISIYSEKIGDCVEKNIVKKIVDAKYGKRVRYPQVKASDINKKAGKETAEIVTMLKNSGLIRESDQLEDALNRMFNLPVISQDQKKQDILEGKGRSSQSNASPIQFAEGDNPSKFIISKSDSVKILMESELKSRSELFLNKIAKQFKSELNPVKRRKILKDATIPGKSDYKQKIKLQLAQITDESTRRVVKELGFDGIKFDEFNDLLKDVPKSVKEKLRVTIEAVVDDQDDEMHKRMFFVASQKLDTTESVDALIADMREAKDKYISSAVNLASKNLVSGSVNSARNGVFQTSEVFDQIDSFIIVNPSPEAAICKNLVGRVFSKDEYLTADLPPYHHNCNTTVKAQLIGQRNIKPVNPIGLTPTGSESEIKSILKSKTF